MLQIDREGKLIRGQFAVRYETLNFTFHLISEGLPVMVREVTLTMEIRAVVWTAGGDSSFKAKLKPAVTGGSSGTTRRKKLGDELLALAHMFSTA